jgi:threonine dehydrogenase-like Zn-dependent dehydrogenase
VKAVAPETNPDGDLWRPGDAPSQALEWAVDALAKAGTLSIIGVYPTAARTFPIGTAMNKNLTVNMGNCPHRAYIPHLLELVESGAVVPSRLLTQVEPLSDALEAFRAFDRREGGWIKVALAAAA